MLYYNTILAIHILSAGVWLTHWFLNLSSKSKLLNGKVDNSSKTFITFLLQHSNLIGIIGSMGVLLTGILLVVVNPGYNFFQFSANHWLVSKQIIMVLLLILIFVRLIPSAKEVKAKMNENNPEALNTSLVKFYNTTNAMNIMVLLNLLLALSHRFMG